MGLEPSWWDFTVHEDFRGGPAIPWGVIRDGSDQVPVLRWARSLTTSPCLCGLIICTVFRGKLRLRAHIPTCQQLLLSQPTSPSSEDPARSNVTAIRLCSSVVIDDPKKQTSVCVNVQSCSKECLAEEALAPSGRPLPTPSLQAHPEAKKTRPDVLPFRRQDSAGPVLDGARSRRSSSSSTTPTSANSLFQV